MSSDSSASAGAEQRDISRMSVTFVGHVDHGKSTVIGRLLADTGALPEGKIEAVRASCDRAGKPFEYAFLLDALKDEQAQGITIDSARCFFRGKEREYVLIDAPGHVEFLKNMVSGAARAEAALLVIDANEGVQENSRRHATLLRMLGIPRVVVLVNKMDLVEYGRERFESIVEEYRAFLGQLDLASDHFIPVSALEGENIARRSEHMAWYEGPTALEALDGLPRKGAGEDGPLRLPVQDVYKFAAAGDERRIVAGTIASGTLRVGDAVQFFPSGKRSMIASLERFNAPERDDATAGEAIGVTLTEQIYVRRGEIMSHPTDAPATATKVRASVFWMARQPLERGGRYKLKLASGEVAVEVTRIEKTIDATDLERGGEAEQLPRHGVAEIVLDCRRAIALDRADNVAFTGRFVLVDGYEIAGGGLVLDVLEDDLGAVRRSVETRDLNWIRSGLSHATRHRRMGHRPALVMITGSAGTGRKSLARALEKHWFEAERMTYFLAIGSVVHGVDLDLGGSADDADEHLRRFGEVAHLMLDAGLIVVSSAQNLGAREFDVLRTLVAPHALISVGVAAECDCDIGLAEHPSSATAISTIEERMTKAGIWDV